MTVLDRVTSVKARAREYGCRVQAYKSVTEGRRVLEAVVDILGALKRRAHERENPATVFLLRHLRESGPRRVSDLAESSRLDVSTVSRHVKALEEAGHLVRVEDPDDKRACLLNITPGGARLYDAAMAARCDVLERALSDWSAADRELLAGLMDRLAEELAPHETRSHS